MTIKAGSLNKRIEFGKFKKITNTEGFKSSVWAPDFKMWASASNLFGSEFWAAKSVQGENTVKFKCRYNKQVNEKQYILFEGNYYEIISIDNVKYQNKELEIKASILVKDKLNVN